MRNVIETLESRGYVANADEVEQLAAAVYTGSRASGTYLRVLVAACQAILGPTPVGRRKRGAAHMDDVLAVVDSIHGKFYPSVLKGVGQGLGENGATERNRRATFARTAAATLRGYVKRGGDLRSLEVATLTKASLRPPVPVPTGTRTERSIEKAQAQLLRSLQRLARGDPDLAQERIETVLEALQDMLHELPGPLDEVRAAETQVGATTVITGRAARSRGGAPAGAMLHKSA